MDLQDSFLTGANIDFIEGLYARYLEDPASVDPSWRGYFSQNPMEASTSPVSAPAPAPDASGAMGMGLQARVDQTVYAFRLRGHLLAQLDPLGRPRPPLEHASDLGMVSERHFTPAELEQGVDTHNAFPQKRMKLGELLGRMRRTYCHHIGVEFMTLLDSDRRRWLTPRMEHGENRAELSLEDQRRILKGLSDAEAFEHLLHTKYQGAKRFSVDGGESLIPMLQTMLDEGGKLGVDEVVIGMAHRGRLNVLTNIMGKSPSQIISEFDGPSHPEQYLNRGDVKYHMGFSSDYVTPAQQKIHLSLAFNPSHLEFVHPVVEGRVRAKQERGPRETAGKKRVLPLVIHGDGSMAGQGVIAETLNLSRLKGYDTGGTIHLVINNQLGYTTDPEDARSSIYCTAIAQMLDIPIFHVNGDDPEACIHVMRLATQYRQLFQSDVVVDLVCFRRYGHNEGDEPSYTQPQMYELIRAHPTVRQLYAEELEKSGRISAADAEAVKTRSHQHFLESYTRAKENSQFKEPSALEGLWQNYRGGVDSEAPQANTAVAKARLTELLEQLATVPEGFTPIRQMAAILERRHKMAHGEQPLDWSAGELLAYATLLTEGFHVRLTGQDTERGTFGHRNAVLHDAKSGQTYCALKKLAQGQAPFNVYNSPLSETGCLGFEFGYSLDYPDALVAWEAQFGDFGNCAQVIIDQFMVAAERKWKRLSGLTLLLPHGYEGAGPEHSSARLERYLELAAEDNIQVCYPTSPAQLFHLLRRQVLRPYRKPLVVMTPKSLLRADYATSTLAELSTGTFQRVLTDTTEIPSRGVTRLLLCSGKVFYDLLAARKDPSVGIARVEQLYPFPKQELQALMASMPKLQEIFWVQEEPRNMGAWRYVFPLLTELVTGASKTLTVGYVGRVESASPATGFMKTHVLEQKLIVEEAMSRGTKNGR